ASLRTGDATARAEMVDAAALEPADGGSESGSASVVSVAESGERNDALPASPEGLRADKAHASAGASVVGPANRAGAAESQASSRADGVALALAGVDSRQANGLQLSQGRPGISALSGTYYTVDEDGRPSVVQAEALIERAEAVAQTGPRAPLAPEAPS